LAKDRPVFEAGGEEGYLALERLGIIGIEPRSRRLRDTRVRRWSEGEDRARRRAFGRDDIG
jgi:hypothetical protein